MTTPSIRVLLVEDNPTDVLLLREALAEVRLASFQLSDVAQLAGARPYLSQEKVDVILLDLGLPDSQGLDTLVKLRQQAPQIPIVVLTGLADEELGLKALQAGAQDYLVKGQVEGNGLARAIRYAIERKRAKAALWESAEYFRATFDQAFVGMAHVAPDGRWLRVNQKLSDIVGYSPQELLQGTVQQITHPDDHAGDLDYINRALAGELQTYSREKRYLHKEGRVIWVNLTASLVRDAAGEPQYFIAIVQDITARRQAQAEIQQRNRELALLNQVIAASALNGEPEIFLEVVCRELVQAFDLPRVNAMLFERENAEAVIVAEATAGAGQSALNWRFRVERNPPVTYLFSHQGPFVVADIGQDPHLAPFHELARQHSVDSLLILPLMVDRNIIGSLNLCGSQPRHFSTEEINLAWSVADQVAGALARARMTQTQQRLSAAIEQVGESVIITNTQGVILYVNPAFERVTGYSRAEAMGQTMRLVKSGRHEPAFYQELWTTITAGQVWQGRFINKKKDGSLYPEEVTVTPVRNDSGAIVNYIGVQRDVTRELQLEEQYRQSQKMEAIGRLSGGVAHDFNNLLVVINGYSELLLNRHLDAASPLRKHVEEIARAGDRAAGLTQQLLAFSRKQVLQPKILNLNEAIAQAEKMLRRLIGEDIDLISQLRPDLGEVKADPGQIEQIILNLGVNARDAMPRGGKLIIETANVELDETYTSQHAEVKPGRYVMLAVSDTGVGMDAATKARIFEPFFTTKEQGRGTGLGLATVYGIVKQSGGHIWVYSEVERGTTFKIYLPRLDKAVQPLEQPADLTAVAGGVETVLLVEDETIVRTLAREVLELNGYTVLEAEHGQAALRLAQQHRPVHLLLTDLIMPGGLTGRELAERLESFHPGMKVIYMSGYTDDAMVHHGVLTSEVHFLQKPFTPLALSAKVRRVLDGA
ncbi:MAG: PAS domain S-box protein [Anaerolineae bacterium]|nr:PAS domain S-box protein [Anaerolineae bacterium]